MKLDGTHQILVYTDDVNILGGGVHIIQENAETLIVAGRESGLEVNAGKTKNMVMYLDQNTGPSHSMKTDKRCFEGVEESGYLGTNLTNQNSIREETEKTEVRKCLLSFGAGFFVFQFAIQKFKD